MTPTRSNDETEPTTDRTVSTDGRGVAPVVASILMIAIAVVLAAAIGIFLLDTGGGQQTIPQTELDFNYTGSNLTIEHFSGSTIDGENALEVTVLINGTPDGNSPWFQSGGDPITATDTYVVDDTGRLAPGAEVEVVWIGPEGERSQVLEFWEVP